jgi:hypothetical protein
MTDILALQGLEVEEPAEGKGLPLSSLWSIVCCR